MATAQLDPSSLIFREANTKEKIACWRASSTLWGKNISTEDFIEHERINGSGELTRNRGARYWALTDPVSTSGEDEAKIYSAVQTLKKPVVVKTADGNVSVESAYAVAGVFTPAPFRKQGVASKMLQRLGEWLDGAEANARFSVLFTSIPNFYSPLGWHRFPAYQTEIAPAHTSHDTKSITVDMLPNLCERDVEAFISDFRAAPLPEGKHTRVAFLPTFAQAMWHYGAEEFMASKLYTSPSRKPTIKGAISKSGNTWGYWHHIFHYETLMFLRTVSLSPKSTPEEKEARKQELAQILLAAQQEAAEWSFKKIVIWNPDAEIQGACEVVLNGEKPKVEARTGSLPCLRWKGDDEAGVDWAPVDKYCWC